MVVVAAVVVVAAEVAVEKGDKVAQIRTGIMQSVFRKKLLFLLSGTAAVIVGTHRDILRDMMTLEVPLLSAFRDHIICTCFPSCCARSIVFAVRARTLLC